MLIGHYQAQREPTRQGSRGIRLRSSSCAERHSPDATQDALSGVSEKYAPPGTNSWATHLKKTGTNPFKEEVMANLASAPITRRSVVAGLALNTASVAVLAPLADIHAATTSDKSLYERLGGVFAIAAVVDHFSDAIVKNPIVGQKSKNPQLREWHTNNLDRLPGLKFMRTLWVCDASGGPLKFTATEPGKTPLGLEEAHREFRISPAEFDEVAAELGRSLDHFKVPKSEKAEVLAAFAAHKNEVTAGYKPG
jgi:hemoglobin